MVNEALELTEKEEEEETRMMGKTEGGGKAFCPTLGQWGTLSDAMGTTPLPGLLALPSPD